MDDDDFLDDLGFDASAISTVLGSVHRNSGDFSRLLYGLERYACILSVYAAISFEFGDEDPDMAALPVLSFIFVFSIIGVDLFMTWECF